jgi:hypothetical protein
VISTISAQNVGNDPCKYCFAKEKKSKKKSILFNNDSFVITNLLRFYNDGKRQIFIQFKNDNGKNLVALKHQTSKKSFKRPFTIGNFVKIGIHFEDNSSFILAFENNENYSLFGSYVISTNETIIDEKFSELLKSKKIIKIEFLNPFNNRQQGIVKTKNLSHKYAEAIKLCYSCFLNKQVQN